LNKYYWKPFEQFCKQYHDGVNINIYNNKYFSNISKNSLIFIQTKRDCNINKIIHRAERHLFYYQPLFKEYNEIILILIIQDPYLRISFDNKYKINNLEEIQNKYNVKVMILNIDKEFLGFKNIKKIKFDEEIINNLINQKKKKKTIEYEKKYSELIEEKFQILEEEIKLKEKFGQSLKKQSKLKENLIHTMEERSKLKEKVSEMNNLYNKLNERISQIKEEKSKLNNDDFEFEQKYTKIKEMLSQFEKLKSELDSKNNQFKDICDDLIEKISELDKEITKLEQESSDLDNKIS